MTRPPRLARWLLDGIVRADDRDYFLGDLDEAFADRLATLGGGSSEPDRSTSRVEVGLTGGRSRSTPSGEPSAVSWQ